MNTFLFLIKNECRVLYRETHEWLHPLIFFCMMLVLFPLSFSAEPMFLATIAPGCVWIATLFSSLLSIQHFFVHDLEDGFLEVSLLADASLSMQMIAKFSARWFMHIIPLLLLSFLMAPLFHLNLFACLVLALSLILGTPILMLIGIFAAALTIGLKQQGVMMGMLLFPLILPVMIFAIGMVAQFSAGLSVLGPLSFLAGLAVLSITLLPIAISAALRLVIQ